MRLILRLTALTDQDLQEEKVGSNAIEEKDEKVIESTDYYVIFAGDVSVKSQADAINQLLDRLVSDKSTIYASEVNHKILGKDMWTLFWSVPLTASQAGEIKADPNVSEPPAKAIILYQATTKILCAPIASKSNSSI